VKGYTNGKKVTLGCLPEKERREGRKGHREATGYLEKKKSITQEKRTPRKKNGCRSGKKKA